MHSKYISNLLSSMPKATSNPTQSEKREMEGKLEEKETVVFSNCSVNTLLEQILQKHTPP